MKAVNRMGLNLLTLALGTLLGLAAPARAARLLPPAAGDLAAATLTADVAPAAADVERSPLSLSWPIDQAAEDLASPSGPHTAESRACWHLADAPALAEGVRLPLSEPGALLKLSPQSGAGLDAGALELVDPRGDVHPGTDALTPVLDSEHLRRAGIPFSPGTALFTVRPELGPGTFVLRARVTAPVLVYLLERDAPTYLSLTPSSDVVLAGGSVHLIARLRDRHADLEVRSITGELVAPDGLSSPFALTRAADGSYHADLRAPAHRHRPGALHTLQVHVDGVTARGLAVRRTVTSALAVASPTARYTGAVAIEDVGAGGVRIRLGVDVAAASRFAATAILYGANRHGVSQPIGVAQAARWLEPGLGELVLDVDPATIAASGLRAPYELRDLRLVDQGRLAPLHRQARAIALPPARD